MIDIKCIHGYSLTKICLECDKDLYGEQQRFGTPVVMQTLSYVSGEQQVEIQHCYCKVATLLTGDIIKLGTRKCQITNFHKIQEIYEVELFSFDIIIENTVISVSLPGEFLVEK